MCSGTVAYGAETRPMNHSALAPKFSAFYNLVKPGYICPLLSG